MRRFSRFRPQVSAEVRSDWWETPASVPRVRISGSMCAVYVPGWSTDAAGTRLRARVRREEGLSSDLYRVRCLLDEWSPPHTVFLRSYVGV
ncbi:hypothetical protein M271_00220 [Streptomyces rapamycinicus NRRL 5491]|nr:hypothetical protein M271_00220 [Streptomyces rapamycinicus NRRL 5491]